MVGADWGADPLIRKELERDKLRGRAARRAWNFEKRLEEGKGEEIARECLEEIKKRLEKNKKSEWEEEREKFYRERGLEDKILWKRENGMVEYGIVKEREKELQKKERREKIENSNYNKGYVRIKSEEIPEYLKKGWSEERWKRIARFRLGNEMKESQYWEEEEGSKCRICERERETWEHVWESCGRGEEEEKEG
ncbi:hypothetical protein RF55_14109 [Lasius niger]|uniref:Uncharacterized protein n=1 Tax=Lasius niger TaxID=67767 RepID=A0A0J7N2C8_LASNI|nr:hypothetical protein RF55_14109 [Lasius niger]